MIRSKLPHVGTTIFTVMTNRARELNAINLAQGFPDYDAPAKLKDLVAYHVAAGHNQYAPMIGVPQLREPPSATACHRSIPRSSASRPPESIRSKCSSPENRSRDRSRAR
jgi:hypothetical protein